MNPRLVNTARISISNFTFDSKTNTISFSSTNTNKCWSRVFSKISFAVINVKAKDFNQNNLNLLKKLCKNGNN
jgi:hypothetical protein